MPKRKDLKKILVIGAGPIIIGQACEFDYSGTQACKALRDEGYKVVLINSNPPISTLITKYNPTYWGSGKKLLARWMVIMPKFFA